MMTIVMMTIRRNVLPKWFTSNFMNNEAVLTVVKYCFFTIKIESYHPWTMFPWSVLLTHSVNEIYVEGRMIWFIEAPEHYSQTLKISSKIVTHWFSGGVDKGLCPSITSLRPGSVAQRCDALCAGDRVTAVNGISTSRLKHDEIVNLLRGVEDRAVLELEYPLPNFRKSCSPHWGRGEFNLRHAVVRNMTCNVRLHVLNMVPIIWNFQCATG
jgi:Periplasmic protease